MWMGVPDLQFSRVQNEAFVNAVDPVPEASGLSYPELVERLLDLAVERHAGESTKSTGVRELGGT